jgi:hypothetical protein
MGRWCCRYFSVRNQRTRWRFTCTALAAVNGKGFIRHGAGLIERGSGLRCRIYQPCSQADTWRRTSRAGCIGVLMIAGHHGIHPRTATGIIHSKRSAARRPHLVSDASTGTRDNSRCRPYSSRSGRPGRCRAFRGMAARLMAGRRVARCQGIADTIVQ